MKSVELIDGQAFLCHNNKYYLLSNYGFVKADDTIPVNIYTILSVDRGRDTVYITNITPEYIYLCDRSSTLPLLSFATTYKEISQLEMLEALI